MTNSIKISGDGFVSEGKYNVIKIMGDVSSVGDIYAQEVKIKGDAEFNGNLNFEKLNITGNTFVTGDIKVKDSKLIGDLVAEGNLNIDKLIVSGDCKFKSNVKCEIITINGNICIESNLKAKEININGILKVKGNIECENMTINGMIECDGIINATKVIVHPYTSSYCNIINSNKVEVSKYKRKSIFSRNKIQHGRFYCESIIADDVNLENSEIKYVEYTDNFIIDENCLIENKLYKT